MHLRLLQGSSSALLLGRKEMKLTPNKVKAIIQMAPPRNLRELQGLQRQLAYVRQFILNLLGRCQPFTRLLKKDKPFIWEQAHQIAFESIKQYLIRPPVLMAQVQGRPLILYTTALEQYLGAMLAQHNDAGKEYALYYIS